jgi:ABC-type phosphate transport system substrate-binding protein
LKIKKIAAFTAVAAVAVAGSALVAPAFAEPVSNSYVLVGSDTLQDSANALINGTSVTGSFVRVTSADGSTLGSYDAFGTPTIQVKPDSVAFGRPAGSGAGINALRASINFAGNATYTPGAPVPAKTITGLVDVARSSSGPGTNANADGKLLYYPFARDAVAYAYKGGTAAWSNITAAQLKQIYEGTLTSIDGVTVKPRLPQPSSGTRSFFLAQIGSTGKGVADAATSTLAENDASVLGDNEIIPFSAASWIAQANGVTPTNSTTAAGVALGSPIAGVAPFTGSGSSLVPNADYYNDGTFGRDTYLVVERSRVQSSYTTGKNAYDPTLAALFNGTSKSLNNFGVAPNSAGAVKTKFGFLKPSSSVAIAAYPNY